MGDIILFPTEYIPTLEELERLESWQRQLALWRADLARAHQLKGLNAGQIYLSRERFHNGIRDNWKIYTGLREDKVSSCK